MAATSASAPGATGTDHAVVMGILSATSHFEVLGKGLHWQSSDDEIKKAYRVMALKSHPDKNKHERAEEAFKRVHSAFQALETQEKRDTYHRRHGGTGFAQTNASRFEDEDPFDGAGFGSHDSAFDFFEMFMGMGGGFGGRGGHVNVTMDDLVRLMMFREMMRGSFGGGGIHFSGGGGGGSFPFGDMYDDDDDDERYDYEEDEDYYEDRRDENDFEPDDLDYHTMKPGKPGYYVCTACEKNNIKDTGFELFWHQRDDVHIQNLRNYRMYGDDEDEDDEEVEEEEEDDDDMEINAIRRTARGEYYCDACHMSLGTSELGRVTHEEGFTHLLNVEKMSQFMYTMNTDKKKNAHQHDDDDDDWDDEEEEEEEESVHDDIDNEFIERRKVASGNSNNEDARFDHQVRSSQFQKGMTFNLRSRMYVCRTCNVALKEESDMADHLASKKHQQEVRSAQIGEKDDYFCRLCDSLCHGRRQIQEHVHGKRHQKALKSANVNSQKNSNAAPNHTKRKAKSMKRT